jgi:hypothetical protein
MCIDYWTAAATAIAVIAAAAVAEAMLATVAVDLAARVELSDNDVIVVAVVCDWPFT